MVMVNFILVVEREGCVWVEFQDAFEDIFSELDVCIKDVGCATHCWVFFTQYKVGEVWVFGDHFMQVSGAGCVEQCCQLGHELVRGIDVEAFEVEPMVD